MIKSKLKRVDFVNKLYNKLKKEHSITKKSIDTVVYEFITLLREEISELEPNDRIEFRGFGTFSVKTKKARIARNPKTGECVQVPSKRSVYFKIGRELKALLSKKS